MSFVKKKNFVTWLSLWDVIRHFISQGGCVQLFFEEKRSPYRVERHVLINLKLIGMTFGCDVRWFMIESPVGRHVDDFKVGSWLRVKFPVSWASCSDLFYLKESVTWCLHQGRIRFFYCYCLFLMLRNDVCFRSSNYRWASCSYNQRHGLLLKPVGFSKTH